MKGDLHKNKAGDFCSSLCGTVIVSPHANANLKKIRKEISALLRNAASSYGKIFMGNDWYLADIRYGDILWMAEQEDGNSRSAINLFSKRKGLSLKGLRNVFCKDDKKMFVNSGIYVSFWNGDTGHYRCVYVIGFPEDVQNLNLMEVVMSEEFINIVIDDEDFRSGSIISLDELDIPCFYEKAQKAEQLRFDFDDAQDGTVPAKGE